MRIKKILKHIQKNRSPFWKLWTPKTGVQNSEKNPFFKEVFDFKAHERLFYASYGHVLTCQNIFLSMLCKLEKKRSVITRIKKFLKQIQKNQGPKIKVPQAPL